MTEQEMIDMKIGEAVQINRHEEVMRVPGGWIYTIWQATGVFTVTYNRTFVPMPPKKEEE